MCKSVCVTSSHLTSSQSFLAFAHSLSTTLSPSYGLSLAMFILLLSVLYQHKCFNAPLQCSPYHIDILPLLYDQLLHFPSLSCLCSTYNIVCIYICTYTLLTYLTHLTTLCKYAGETCSSTLAGHPYHC